MALADTARLIASLELQDKFTGPAKRAEGSLSSLDRKMGTIGASGQRLGAGLSRAFSTIAKIGVGVAAGGVALLAVNIKAGVESLSKLESVTTQTSTVIESTGGVAGKTAGEIRGLAEQYESLNAVMDDKVIQSAENMLLTFTNVTDKAFEPALEAVLNINQAMGGGEEGLQQQAIRVGKALNDPTKGLAALTRVGVTFSKEQADRIKRLQEEGDLYGAQKIVLQELEREFGGQFAAAGKTAEGQMAKLGDTIEDLQTSLAGPLIPVIDRVRGKLINFLGSREALTAARTLGDAIANLFTNKNINKGVDFLETSLAKVTELLQGGGDGLTSKASGLSGIADNIGGIAQAVAGLPWQSIGNAAKLLGTGSKALLDAFLGLPPWVQTAVLTGWGLNKLTGGALTGIVGELSKGLVKGVLGINAGVVNVRGAVVNGPGGGLPGGGKGGGKIPFIPPILGAAGGIALPLILSGSDNPNADPKVVQQATLQALLDAGLLSEERFQKLWAQVYAGRNISALLDRIEANGAALKPLTAGQRREILNTQETARHVLATGRETAARLRAGFNDTGGKLVRVHGAVDSARTSIATSNAHLAAIERKKTSFHLNNTVNVNTEVEFSASAAAIQIRRVTQTTGNQQDFEVLN